MLQYREKYIDNLASLPAALRSYIPKQLLKNVKTEYFYGQNELDYVQNVMDNSNDKLRMYGSAESLLTSLKAYMNFPLSRKMFPLGMGNYCYTIPHYYQTLKKEILYCKQDYLFYLQSCVYAELELFDDEQKLKFAELIEYMKKHEERLSGCYEFVKYDNDVFEDIGKSFFCSRSLYVFPENAVVTAVERGDCTIIPYEEKDFVKVFDNLISKYPCLFLPNNETKDKNATAVVRIFDNRNSKFVMESELFAAINLKNQEQEPLKCMDIDGHYRTIDYKHVLERYQDQIGDIDFIHHTTSICLHVAMPIAAPTGDHCIEAVEAQHDILTETFLAFGVFQKITRNTCHMIPKFVASLEKYFPSNIKYRYFMNLKLFRKLQEELEEFWKPIEDRPVKRVRDVGPQGFTAEDLKKELKYLGYTEIFPECIAVARAVYTNSLQSHKPNELGTINMLKAIQDVLTLVMFKRYPSLNEFVYRQKVCMHIRANPCGPCVKAIKEAETRVEAEIKAESEQASYTVAATTAEDDAEKKEDSEESKAESMTSNAPSIAMNNLVEDETKPIPVISESEAPENNPVSSVSNTEICEKCMETSNEARGEVIETYRKMMVLEKMLMEKNAELERLRLYEEKSKRLDETEKKMKDLEKEAEEWKMKHLKILEENVKMGNMLKSTGNQKMLESQVKEKDEQLKVAQKALDEKDRRLGKLEKTMKEKDEEIYDLSESEKSLNQEKGNFQATLNRLLSQLKYKDKEIVELKIVFMNAEASKIEEVKKLKQASSELEKRMNVGLEQLKVKDSKIRELELKNSKLNEAKNEEIEKLKKEQALATKEDKKEIEELKRNALKSADELKKLTAKISEKEAAENLLKRSNKGLLEKLRKSESNLQEIIIGRGHLEAEFIEKNRMILELQKSVEKLEKSKKEHETRISKILGVLNSPPEQKPEETPDTECYICLSDMQPNEKTLKCEHCRKIVHLKCASEWLKGNRSCAHCRQKQLDPNEFPSLR